MVGRRKYDSGCAVAHALDLVGERWALLVARELMLGPKRFADLQLSLPDVSPNVLSQRLRELTRMGAVRRRRLPPPAASWVYELTTWGEQLGPVMVELGRWGMRSSEYEADQPVTVDSAVLVLTPLFEASVADGVAVTVALHLGTDVFSLQVVDKRVELKRGEPADPDLTLETDLPTWLQLLRGTLPVRQAIADGTLRTDADPTTVESFYGLFPWPERAEAAVTA